MINPFLDERPIPKLDINLKVKIKVHNQDEYKAWNSFFSYLMKKPKSKLNFITASILRNMNISLVTFDKIKDYLNEQDRLELEKIKDIFDNNLSVDLKIYILSIYQVPIKVLQ